jgi:hypothetical protein
MAKKRMKPKTKISRQPLHRKKRSTNDIITLVLLIGVILVGLFLRLRYVTNPLLDFHFQRQVDTAAVARNFFEEGMNILYPRIDWRGTTPGYVEMEFPLYEYLIAILYFIFGQHDIIGRFLSILFAVGTSVYLFAIARRLIGREGSLFALVLFACAPLPVYFTRTVQPESMYLFAATASYFYYLRYLEEGRRSDAAFSAGFLSIAFGLKIAVALPLFFLYLATALNKKGTGFIRDFNIWMVALVPSTLGLLWTWHAGRLYEMTGLSFTRWLMTRDSLFNTQWLMDPGYWKIVWNQRFVQDLTIVGFALVAAGVLICAIEKRWRPVFWGNVGFLFYFFFFMRANLAHNYYQLIGVLPATLAFGAFWQYAHNAASRRVTVSPALFAGVLTAVVAVISYLYFIETPNWYLLMTPYMEAGQAVARVSKPYDLVVTATDNGMGEMLYYAHRKGTNVSAVPDEKAMQEFRKLGYKYLVIFAGIRSDPEGNSQRLQEIWKYHKIVTRGPSYIVFQI